jgi:hypothetical protein
LEAASKDSNCVDNFDDVSFDFGVSPGDFGLFWAALIGYIPVVAVDLLIFVSFF